MMAPVVREVPTPLKDQQHLNRVSILVGISQLFDDKIECGPHRFGLSLNRYSMLDVRCSMFDVLTCFAVLAANWRTPIRYRLILINSDSISSLVVMTLELA